MHVVLFYFIVFLKMKLYIGSSYFKSVLFFNFFFFSFIISFFLKYNLFNNGNIEVNVESKY